MPRPNYVVDDNFYGINNFGGCGCPPNNGKPGGDFMASFDSVILTCVNPDTGNSDASKIKVEDVNNYFEGEDVETILAEIGKKMKKIITDINFTDTEHLIFETADGKVIDVGAIPGTNYDTVSGGGAPKN